MPVFDRVGKCIITGEAVAIPGRGGVAFGEGDFAEVEFFFEAQGQLEDLNVKIAEGCSRIRELKETIRLLDMDLVESAREIQDLNSTRSNLLALQQKLRLILYVNQSLSALNLVFFHFYISAAAAYLFLYFFFSTHCLEHFFELFIQDWDNSN